MSRVSESFSSEPPRTPPRCASRVVMLADEWFEPAVGDEPHHGHRYENPIRDNRREERRGESRMSHNQIRVYDPDGLLADKNIPRDDGIRTLALIRLSICYAAGA